MLRVSLGILSNIVSNEEHKVGSDSDNLCCDVLWDGFSVLQLVSLHEDVGVRAACLALRQPARVDTAAALNLLRNRDMYW